MEQNPDVAFALQYQNDRGVAQSKLIRGIAIICIATGAVGAFWRLSVWNEYFSRSTYLTTDVRVLETFLMALAAAQFVGGIMCLRQKPFGHILLLIWALLDIAIVAYPIGQASWDMLTARHVTSFGLMLFAQKSYSACIYSALPILVLILFLPAGIAFLKQTPANSSNQ